MDKPTSPRGFRTRDPSLRIETMDWPPEVAKMCVVMLSFIPRSFSCPDE